MRDRKPFHGAILGALISVPYLISGVSHAEPVDFVRTQSEAESFASNVEGQIVFDGGAQGGNIEYVKRARVVPFKKVFLIQFETVFLLNVDSGNGGELKVNSACGEGTSYGNYSLNYIYLLDESGIAKNAYDETEETYISKDIFSEVEICFNKLHAIHADKNLSEIAISDISGQTITLSWFSNERYDHFSDPESQFNIWETSKISVTETRASEAPVIIEVQRISKMACDDGGPPYIVEDWKRGASPWTPLENIEKGIFQDKNVMPATFPDYDKSELDTLIAKQTGWNTQFVSCRPMDLGSTYRIIRDDKILFEIHIPVAW